MMKNLGFLFLSLWVTASVGQEAQPTETEDQHQQFYQQCLADVAAGHPETLALLAGKSCEDLFGIEVVDEQ